MSLSLFLFFADIPVGWEEKKEKHNFKLPHLHWCHRFIKRWREFCWKAQVHCTSYIHSEALLKTFKPAHSFAVSLWSKNFFYTFPRSNLMGTKFTVFDNALNPERALPDMSNARQELAGIIYVCGFTAYCSSIYCTCHEYCFRLHLVL